MSGTAPANRPPNAPGPTGSADDAYLAKSQKRSTNMGIIAVLIVVILVLAVIAGAYAAGWIGKSSSPGPSTPTNNTKPAWLPTCGGSLTAGGSTFVYPLQAVWTNAYAGLKCNSTGTNGATSTQINYQAVGSGAGISSLTSGLYIFGASDAPLTPTQTSTLKSPAVTMVDSAGAVAIIYNLAVKNSTGATIPLRMTGTVLTGIYNGTITTWNDPAIAAINPAAVLPSSAITVEHRSDGSGTSFAFTTFLTDSSAWWKAHVGPSTTPAWPTGLGQKGSEGVAGAVASTSGSIGYDELNYAEEEGTALEIATVENPAGNYILPSVADTNYAVQNASNLPDPKGNWSGYSIINGGGGGTYPIATLTYLMIYTDIGTAPAYSGAYTQSQATALVQYLWWIVHTGQNDSAGQFYVPLPKVFITLDETAIGDIQYKGAALVSHAPSS